MSSISDVDSLIFTILVNVVELTEHSQKGQVGSCVVNDSFRAVLDEKF